MKKTFKVIWIEVHSAFVECENEDDAIGLARSQPDEDTWNSFVEDETNVMEVDENRDEVEEVAQLLADGPPDEEVKE